MDLGDYMEGDISPSNGGPKPTESKVKPKIVVIMGASGSGKSRLAIDLASHFPIEIINADSMQVYEGLDVLTNKVTLHEQKGVPHHLLGTVSAEVEFTAKDFRDSAVPVIDDILSRDCLPVIVGGTNYYIQALVSQFLLEGSAEDLDECCFSAPNGNEMPDYELEFKRDSSCQGYELLKDVDPVAANRIHPNNNRKVNQYLSLYARSGVLPSKLFQGKASENWGRVDDCKYDCCFLCVDVSLPVLDHYVEQRVDRMVDDGLFKEVIDIYNLNADYTRGLRQAVGVREFENFLAVYLGEAKCLTDESSHLISMNKSGKVLAETMKTILDSRNDIQLKTMLKEAIDSVKANTRRLVRRQKRRLNRLQSLFGWNIYYVDATESIACNSEDRWNAEVIEPAVNVIRCFLDKQAGSVASNINGMQLRERNLWTQYTCEPCGNRILRGSYEWEQHINGRGHRKRLYQLKKAQVNYMAVQQKQQQKLVRQ